MTKTVCVWCSAPVEVACDYDDLIHKAICSKGCKDAENLFCQFFSDEEINRRAHYRHLTEGEDEQGTE